MAQRKRKEPQAPCPQRALAWCSDCCGLKYSACYTIFSLWGFIMLMVMGYLLQSNYRPIHMNELTPDEAAMAATSSYAAGGIYAVFMVLCGVRFGYIMWSTRRRVQHI